MKILIVEDHAIVREGLRRLLGASGEHLFAEAEDGPAALEAAARFRPDLTILDLNLPGLGGFELLRRLADDGFGRILVLTMHGEAHFARRALEGGAHGYVSKNASPEELLTAVARVGRGGRYVDADIAQAMALQTEADPRGLSGLSVRELEILRLLARGDSLAEIAEVLGVSYKTVANNCAVLKSKLGVTRTADLLRLAMDAGYGQDMAKVER